MEDPFHTSVTHLPTRKEIKKKKKKSHSQTTQKYVNILSTSLDFSAILIICA